MSFIFSLLFLSDSSQACRSSFNLLASRTCSSFYRLFLSISALVSFSSDSNSFFHTSSLSSQHWAMRAYLSCSEMGPYSDRRGVSSSDCLLEASQPSRRAFYLERAMIFDWYSCILPSISLLLLDRPYISISIQSVLSLSLASYCLRREASLLRVLISPFLFSSLLVLIYSSYRYASMLTWSLSVWAWISCILLVKLVRSVCMVYEDSLNSVSQCTSLDYASLCARLIKVSSFSSQPNENLLIYSSDCISELLQVSLRHVCLAIQSQEIIAECVFC